MNKERVDGAVDELIGTVKRMVGESAGDLEVDVDGTVQQMKGEAETAEGRQEEAAEDAKEHEAASPKSEDELKRETEIAENHNLL